MIAVAEAKQIISDNCHPPEPVNMELSEAYGRINAENIFSEIDIPPFTQSSMDGYAFNFEGYAENKLLSLVGEMAAGDQRKLLLQPNEAVRIFTGAPVPEGADTVVMQEKILIENDKLFIKDEMIKPDMNVRAIGAEVRKGMLAFEKENLLTPAAIGFLSGIGIKTLKVYPSPRLSIITTGNELQEPGKPLQYGQVYESNSFTLKAALELLGVKKINSYKVKDNLDDLVSILQTALMQSDMLLLTGGVSVGDYDFVSGAAEHCGITKLFHRVKQKPGKPLYFGTKDNKIIFGLPGNPSSVLSCFYQYVTLALLKMKNNKHGLKKIKASLVTSFNKPAGLTHFLKGFYDGNSVEILNAQESFRMSSFSVANCLAEIPEEIFQVNAGEMVDIYLLDQ